MGKKTKQSVEQSQATNLFDSLPLEVKEMSVMGLVQFGSSLLLKEAVAAEITGYLGRGWLSRPSIKFLSFYIPIL